MFGFFGKKKRLEKENKELKAILKRYESPLTFDEMLSSERWRSLTEEDQINRMRKLDLILTMKKTGRWDYHNNCAKSAVN